MAMELAGIQSTAVWPATTAALLLFGRHLRRRRYKPHRSAPPPIHPRPHKNTAPSYVWFGSNPVVVGSFELAREFLKNHDAVLVGRPKFSAGKYPSYKYSDITWSQYRPYWRQARKMCLAELFSAKLLESYECMRREEDGAGEAVPGEDSKRHRFTGGVQEDAGPVFVEQSFEHRRFHSMDSFSGLAGLCEEDEGLKQEI